MDGHKTAYHPPKLKYLEGSLTVFFVFPPPCRAEACNPVIKECTGYQYEMYPSIATFWLLYPRTTRCDTSKLKIPSTMQKA